METKPCAYCRNEQQMKMMSGAGEAYIDTFGRMKAWLIVKINFADELDDFGMHDDANELREMFDGAVELTATRRINYCPMCGRSLVDVDWGAHYDYRD